MTFTEIVTAICDHCNLGSDEAVARVGRSVNRHHKRITSTLGMNTTRFVTRSVSMTVGVQSVTFPNIEKIDRILDTTDSTAIRALTPVSLDAQRKNQPGDSEPNTWAPRDTLSSSVTVLTDTVPQTAYSLQADGWAKLSDLSGSDTPVFAESFHDILTFYGIAEELLKKEKPQLAREFASGDENNPGRAENLLRQLRFHLVDTQESVRQGDSASAATAFSSGGGSATIGGTAYTQTALLTFDLGAGAAPFAVAQATAAVVTNLDADKLDGQHGSYYLDRANHTGAIASTSLTVSATDRLIGRDTAGSGASEEITVGGGLSFTGSGGIQIATSGVTLAKIANAAANSKLLGSGASGSGSAYAELTLGTGLSMSDTTLNAAVVAGSDTQVQYNDGGALAGDADFTFTKATNTLAIPQIKFPASQSASSDANTLDDYEEGTWTPADGSGASLSFTTVEGHYVKVGQLVSVAATLTYPSTANGSAAKISGLPFTLANTTNNIYVSVLVNSSGSTMIAVIGVKNTTTATLNNAQSESPFTNANMSTLTLRFTLTYRATA